MFLRSESIFGWLVLGPIHIFHAKTRAKWWCGKVALRTSASPVSLKPHILRVKGAFISALSGDQKRTIFWESQYYLGKKIVFLLIVAGISEKPRVFDAFPVPAGACFRTLGAPSPACPPESVKNTRLFAHFGPNVRKVSCFWPFSCPIPHFVPLPLPRATPSAKKCQKLNTFRTFWRGCAKSIEFLIFFWPK